jgi:hypothetical protein
VLFAILVFVGPVLAFVPNLIELKHRGQLEYGTLASRSSAPRTSSRSPISATASSS